MSTSIRDSIKYLLNRRFPMAEVRQAYRAAQVRDEVDLARWKGRPLKDTLVSVHSYREELTKLSESELIALCDQERKKETAEILAEDRTRIFYQPRASADCKHWAKAAYWTLDEAVALSFGKAPEHVGWEQVEPFLRVSPFANQYGRRRDLALRAMDSKQLSDPVSPGDFIAWAKKLDIAVPKELEAALAAVGVQLTDWTARFTDLQIAFEKLQAKYSDLQEESKLEIQNQRSEIDRLRSRVEEFGATSKTTTAHEKGLGIRERESLLKLVIGMAIGGYGYDPTASRSECPAEIASDLTLNGVPLDVDTVRKWLKEAAELWPPDADKRNR